MFIGNVALCFHLHGEMVFMMDIIQVDEQVSIKGP
jgi:hypothetical protein